MARGTLLLFLAVTVLYADCGYALTCYSCSDVDSTIQDCTTPYDQKLCTDVNPVCVYGKLYVEGNEISYVRLCSSEATAGDSISANINVVVGSEGASFDYKVCKTDLCNNASTTAVLSRILAFACAVAASLSWQ